MATRQSRRVKERMRQAKAHIQAKEYAQARAILRTVDHPTARDWEARLDRIAPAVKKSKRGRWIVVGLFLLIVLAAGVWFIFQAQSAGERGWLQGRLFDHCLRIEIELDGDTSDCNAWAEKYATDKRALACHRLAPDLEKGFDDCLLDESILPPGVYKNR